MESCRSSSTQVNFLDEHDYEMRVIKWLKFCQAIHSLLCDPYLLQPPLHNITIMLDRASKDSCFNTTGLIVYSIVMVMSVAIILTNGILICVICRNKKLRTIPNLIIVSLAASDFLSGFNFLYSSSVSLALMVTSLNFEYQRLFSLLALRENRTLCLAFDGPGLLFTCMMSSLLSLALIAAERYISIFFEYKYPNLLTKTKVSVAITSIWSLSFVVGILPLLGWNKYDHYCQLTAIMDYDYLVLWSSICIFIACIVLYIYTRIFMVALKHSHQITNQSSTVSGASSSDSSSMETRVTAASTNASGSVRSQPIFTRRPAWKAVKTTALILGCFLVAWTPLLVYLLAYHSEYVNTTAYYLIAWTLTNSLLNPLIYGYRNKDIRKSVINMFCCRS